MHLVRMHFSAYNCPVRYEWDEAKRAANLQKHGIDFADAVAVFEDPFALTVADTGKHGEQRWRTLGTDAYARLLVAVWTERGVDVIRIVSSRRATPGEAHHYREG